MEYGGHPAKDHRPRRVESDPHRRALREQPQEQAEETDEHSKVPGAGSMTGPMTRGLLGRITHRTGRAMVLRWVLCVVGAVWRVADQVQGSEDPVAEKQRPHEEERQRPLSDRARKQALKRPQCSRLLRWLP